MEIIIALAVVAVAAYWFFTTRSKGDSVTVDIAAPYKVETPPEAPAPTVAEIASAAEVVSEPAAPKAKKAAAPKAKKAAAPKAKEKAPAKKPRAKKASS